MSRPAKPIRATAVILLALVCAGCSNDTGERAIKAMYEGCAVPVEATLELSQWGNTVKLHCPASKPLKDQKP